jgi:hypothetical protein
MCHGLHCKEYVGLGGKNSGVLILRIYNKITSRIFYFLKDFGLVWLVVRSIFPKSNHFFDSARISFFSSFGLVDCKLRLYKIFLEYTRKFKG